MLLAVRLLCMLILLTGPLDLRVLHACGNHGDSLPHACAHGGDHGGEAHTDGPAGRETLDRHDDCETCEALAQQGPGSPATPPLLVPAARPRPAATPRQHSRPGPAPTRESLAQPPPA